MATRTLGTRRHGDSEASPGGGLGKGPCPGPQRLWSPGAGPPQEPSPRRQSRRPARGCALVPWRGGALWSPGAGALCPERQSRRGSLRRPPAGPPGGGPGKGAGGSAGASEAWSISAGVSETIDFVWSGRSDPWPSPPTGKDAPRAKRLPTNYKIQYNTHCKHFYSFSSSVSPTRQGRSAPGPARAAIRAEAASAPAIRTRLKCAPGPLGRKARLEDFRTTTELLCAAGASANPPRGRSRFGQCCSCQRGPCRVTPSRPSDLRKRRWRQRWQNVLRRAGGLPDGPEDCQTDSRRTSDGPGGPPTDLQITAGLRAK